MNYLYKLLQTYYYINQIYLKKYQVALYLVVRTLLELSVISLQIYK
jgi:hypothetical protein